MIKHFKHFFLISILILPIALFAQNMQLASSMGSGIETGGKLVKDDNGNIYCFGTFTDTMQLGNNLIAVSSGNFDCYIAKFNRYMQPLWIKTIGSTGAEGAGDMSYFDGKLFLGGWYGAQTIVNNDTLIYNFDCVSPGFIASIDTSGNFIRAKAFTKAANSISCFVNAIEVNQTGLVIAGRIKGQFDFGNNHLLNTYLAGTEHDIFVARFDTAFSCNLALNAASSLGLQYGNDGASSVQVDDMGNIYVAGFFGSLAGLGNATLYFGGQTTVANGGYGFADYFVAKIKPSGAVAWLRSSGGETPDFISEMCLKDNSNLVIAGRYADNTDVAGIALPPSPGEYASFVGVIDSAGLGVSAYRISNESTFQSLKKGSDNYIYAADINYTSPAIRFKIYKIQTDTGVISVDSLVILQASNYTVGDILPPDGNCGEIILNGTFNEFVAYHSDTLIENNYSQNLYDFFYGKFSLNNSLLSAPQINSPGLTSFCSNAPDILLSVTNIANASAYHWQIFPTNAGEIIAMGNTANFNLDSTFSGMVKIVCYASNFCNISPLSDTLTLTINQAPIIYNIDDTGFGAVESNLVNATNFNWYLDNVLLNFANMSTINCIGDGVYTIIASNATCSDTLSNIVNCIISATNNSEETQIKIYPNPAHEKLLISSNNDDVKVIKLYDITGKQAKQVMFNESLYTLITSDLSKGMYTVVINSNSENSTFKLIID